MYTIAKRYSFSASHELMGMPEGHQCRRLHGHNYEVEIVVQAKLLDDVGMVVDYGVIDEAAKPVIAEFDHRHLNNWNEFKHNPTAERLAQAIYERMQLRTGQERWPMDLRDRVRIVAVRVSETPRTWAEYRP